MKDLRQIIRDNARQTLREIEETKRAGEGFGLPALQEALAVLADDEAPDEKRARIDRWTRRKRESKLRFFRDPKRSL